MIQFQKKQHSWLLIQLSVILVCAIIILSPLLSFVDWQDENETIVTINQIRNGYRLYSEIFNHHGPYNFLFAIFPSSISPTTIEGYRLTLIGFFGFCCLLILLYRLKTEEFGLSNLLNYITAFLIGFIWLLADNFGHTYIYQTMAGMLCAFAILVFNMNLGSHTKRNIRDFLYYLCICALPFFAISYIPSAVCLLLLPLTRGQKAIGKHLFFILIATTIHLTITLLFLGMYGSLNGYIAYHFYLNLKILPQYKPLLHWFEILKNVTYPVVKNLRHFSAFSLFVVWIIWVKRQKNCVNNSTIYALIAAAAFFTIRSDRFHSLPFHYIALTLFSSIFLIKYEFSRIVSVLLACTLLLVTVWQAPKFKSRKVTVSSKFSAVSQFLTKPSDKIIAYTFRNSEYLTSKRAPISNYFFLLPWQIEYNQAPILGIKYDVCSDVSAQSPKIMLLDKWQVWDKYDWHSYASCFDQILQNYTKISSDGIYLRNDLAPSFTDRAQKIDLDELTLSQKMDADLSFKIDLNALSCEGKFDYVEILFGTYNKKLPGELKLTLLNQQQNIIAERFISLSNFKDNQYQKFQITDDSTVLMLSSDKALDLAYWQNYYLGKMTPCIRFGNNYNFEKCGNYACPNY